METELDKAYQKTVSWLFQQFPAFQNVGASAYKPDLGNIRALINELNLDFSGIKFIHIAGTNGKGTCTNYIGSVLMEQGYTTGIFTSPHILDFRERMLVNGQFIDKETVIDFCEYIKNLSIEPSFFEITFALTLSHFIAKKCDFVVLETGLGGRLDATNIVNPILSIITNIGFDHVQLLGDTLEKIAFEKAGIIKTETPVLIGEFTAETLPVFERVANEKKSEIYFVNDYNVEKSYFPIDNYKRKNEKIILKAIDILRSLDVEISNESIENGFKNIYQNTSYKGRFQVISEKPLEIVDVAHNEDGIKDLLNAIKQISFDKLHIIYGSSSDKEYTKILDLFPDDATLYFTEFSNHRSVKMEELKLNKPNIAYFKDIQTAYSHVKNVRSNEDLTLITGSFYLISDYFAMGDATK